MKLEMTVDLSKAGPNVMLREPAPSYREVAWMAERNHTVEAEQIMLAVNSHAELIDAMQSLRELLSNSEVKFKICDGGRGNLGEQSWYCRAMNQARAAYSLATQPHTIPDHVRARLQAKVKEVFGKEGKA